MVAIDVPVTFSADTAEAKEQVLKKLEEIKVFYQKEFNKGIKVALISPEVVKALGDACATALERLQEPYWGTGQVAEEDPTNVGKAEYGVMIRMEVKRNLEEAVVTPEGSLNLTIIKESFYGGGGGSGGTGGGTSIPWLYYFIEGGLETDLVWVSSESLTALGLNGSAGRFGMGHMWVVPSEEVEEIKGWFESKGVPYLPHPQSGKGPMRVFDNVVEESNIISMIVGLATEYANRSLMTQYKNG